MMAFFLVVESARPAPNSRIPKEELEKIQDPPMFIFDTGTSPAMTSAFGAFTSYQVNVDANGQNITGDAANEPSLSVDPTNPNKMAIGWRQFNSVASNFRQAGWAYTSNGGTSWTFPGVLENNIFRSDPVLAADSTGRFFFLSLLQNFFDDIWRSLDGGQSWTNIAPARGGDKQWFTIDNTNSSGHGFQYQWWSTAGNNYNGRQFTRSTDGGFTWLNPVNIPNSPIWGTLDVDSTGNLFLAGVSATSNQIWCERSSNAKNAAVTPSFDLSTPVDLGGQVDSSEPINPIGLVGQLYLGIDRSGTSKNSNTYILGSVQPTGFTTGSDVMFVRSSDGGRSFNAPHRVNDDPVDHSKWHWLGTFSVAPSGRLDAVWLDTRYAANNTDSQLFYSYSMDAGDTWSTNVPVSASFNPLIGYPNQNKMGDYMSIVSDNGGGNVVYSATFNGEEDIYYVRVAPLESQLLNLSTRARVLTDDQTLIAGFIVQGTTPKQVIIKGLGPSLASPSLTGTLTDPTLELHQGNTLLATNDNWKIRSDGASQQAQIEATGRAPKDDLESAIITTLNPGTYTAILAGKNRGTGIGLVEVFDLDSATTSKLTNVSSRGFVDTDDNVMIGGFIVGGGSGGGARVIVRALGPSLPSSLVPNPLLDPTLELHDTNGILIATNDNWRVNDHGGQAEAEMRASGHPPRDDRESAIVTSLTPGVYTAIVHGKNNTVGVALIEAYLLP